MVKLLEVAQARPSSRGGTGSQGITRASKSCYPANGEHRFPAGCWESSRKEQYLPGFLSLDRGALTSPALTLTLKLVSSIPPHVPGAFQAATPVLEPERVSL